MKGLSGAALERMEADMLAAALAVYFDEEGYRGELAAEELMIADVAPFKAACRALIRRLEALRSEG